MIIKNQLIELIIYHICIDKYIFFYDVCLYFFDIPGQYKYSHNEDNDTENFSKYPIWITKKCKTTNNATTKVNYK